MKKTEIWLEEVIGIQEEIKALEELCEILLTNVTKTTQTISEVKVQGGKKNSEEDTKAKLSDVSRSLDEWKHLLYEAIAERTTAIRNSNSGIGAAILINKHLLGKTWEELSAIHGLAINTLKAYQRNAIEMLEKYLQNKNND